MPSGRLHDRITLWSLPLIAGGTFGLTRNSDFTLLTTGGFLFSGLMFGPDLDIHSRHFIRWGWLRLLWVPYQKTIRHRSVWSHGLIVGTLLRVVYLSFWISLFTGLGAACAYWVWGVQVDWGHWGGLTMEGVYNYRGQVFALWLGLELGAISHVAADTIGSQITRYRRQRLPKKGITKKSSKNSLPIPRKLPPRNPKKTKR